MSLAVKITVNPSCANLFTIANPIPLFAPFTIATVSLDHHLHEIYIYIYICYTKFVTIEKDMCVWHLFPLLLYPQTKKTKKINNCLDACTHVSYIMLNIYIENNIMLNMMLHKCHTFI